MTLNDAVNAVRTMGGLTLGWSKIDQRLPGSPKEGYVGVIVLENEELALQLATQLQESEWCKYFDTTNVSISLQGGTSAAPSQEYARLLYVPLS